MSAPWEDFPVETPEERQKRAGLSLAIMQEEQKTVPPDQAPNLQKEIETTKALAGPQGAPDVGFFSGEPAPTQPIATVKAAPAPEAPWQDFASEAKSQAGPWDDFPQSTASKFWDAIKPIPGTAWGQLKEAAGGELQKAAEAPMGEEALSPQEASIAAERGGGGAPAQRYASAQFGKTKEELAAQRKVREEGPVAKAGAELYKSGEATVKDWDPGNINWWQRAILNAGSSTLTQLPLMAASIAIGSPLPAVIGAAVMQHGQTYGETRQTIDPATGQLYDPERSSAHSVIDAAAEALFEYLPDKFLVEHAADMTIKNMLKFMVREVGGEAATTAVQSANAKLSTRPDMDWQQYAQDILDTIAATAISAPLLAGAGKAMGRFAPRGEPAANQPIPTSGLDPSQDNWALKADQGQINVPLIGPNYDLPTAQLNAQELSDLQAKALALQPDQISEEQANEARVAVEEHEKKTKAPALPGAAMAWSQLSTAPASAVDDIGELGATTKQAANAQNYLNPNTGERVDRQFSFASNDGYVGLTPLQVMPKPGTYVLGQVSDDRPAEFLHPLMQSMEQWRTEYMPSATLVLSNEQLYSNSALGMHYTTGPDSHMIVPAVLRLKGRGLGQFNVNTQASAFYNATHEFGHALMANAFFGQMSQDLTVQARDQGRAGLVNEQLVGQMPQAQAAVAREFNAIKQQVVDGSMNAQQFVEQWMGPAKNARKNFLEELKIAPTAPAMNLVRAIAQRAANNSNIASEIGTEALFQNQMQDFLSLDEYLAEQMARHAYQRQWDKQTPLGKFFSNALSSLRKFFVDRKADGTIKPGVAFQNWVDGLSKTQRALNDKAAVAEAKQNAGKKQKAAPTVAPVKAAVAAVKAAPKVKRTEANAKNDANKSKQQKARAMVTNLVKEGVLRTEDADYRHLLDAVKMNDYEEFLELYKDLSGKTVKFETSLDQYYTHETVASSFSKWIKQRLPQGVTEIVEPSAGSGNIMKHFPGAKGFDIEPRGKGIKKADFLTTKLGYKPGRVFVGNPPFTRAKEFVTKGLQEGDYVAMILPLHFRRRTYTQGIPGNIVDEVMINQHGSFVSPTGKEMETKAVAQLWQRGPVQPGLPPTTVTTRNFEGLNKTDLYQRIRTIDRLTPQEIEAARTNQLGPVGDRGKLPYLQKDFNVARAGVSFEIDPTAVEEEWQKDKFESRFFKAWFGDWRNHPLDSSKARRGIVRLTPNGLTIDVKNPSEPLVAFMSLSKLENGQNHFEASTVLGAHIADAMDPPLEAKGHVPVVLNIRNPFIVTPGEPQAPSRAELQQQGHDGILYMNDLTGDLTWIVFTPDQVKVVPSRKPYKGQTFMELDHDAASADGEGHARLYRGIKNFTTKGKMVRKALAWVRAAIDASLQMQHQAHLNPDVDELTFYSSSNRHYNLYKGSRQAEANGILRDLDKMGKDSRATVYKMLSDEVQGKEHWMELSRGTKVRTDEGGEQTVPWWTFKPNPTTLQKMQEYGNDINTPKGKQVMEMYARIKNNLLDSLNEDEAVMQRILAHRYTNPATYTAAVTALAYDIHQRRIVPSIPRGHFGTFMMTVEKKNSKGKWETVHNEAFENEADWKAGVEKALRNRQADERVEKYQITEKSMAMLSLPKEFLDVAATELDLTQDQVNKLINILTPGKTERLLKDSDLSRLGIAGYSKDFERSFANYSWHHANLQAKMLYRPQFKLAEGQLSTKILAAQRSNDPGSIDVITRLNRLKNLMTKTTEYVMNPPNEMYQVRAIVSQLYLWFNVKTALMNSLGLMTTWSSAVQRFGLLDGEARLMRATYRTGMSVWLSNNKKLAMPPELQKHFDRAIREGVLSQSYAYHSAAYANRTTRPSSANRWGRQAIDLGMMPFRLMELTTRRVSFLLEMEAALEAEKKGTLPSTTSAYDEAVRRVNLTQNDYTLSNRVPFMRGSHGKFGWISPIATIFGSWSQSMSFHTLGGFELGERRQLKLEAKLSGKDYKGPAWYNSYTGRMALMFFALAGYEGLPFGENLLDLAEFLWRKSGHPIPLRQSIREFVQGTQKDPWLFSRGLAHNVAGMDVSRSAGFGRVIPGTDKLATNDKGNTADFLGGLVLDILGPSGSFLKWSAETGTGLGSWATGGGTSKLDKAMKHAPGALGNLYNAYDWEKNGVRGPDGGLITRDQTTGELRALTTAEIYEKALGFNPSIVSENREIIFDMHDQKMFWQTKKADLRRELKDAYNKGDAAAIADAKKKVAEHNSWITDEYPEFKPMRITPAEIAQARSGWRKAKRAEEKGVLPGKKYKGMSERIRESYGPPSDEQ